jgi:N-acetyl-gamma-glutamyl-phosphate reductase common form
MSTRTPAIIIGGTGYVAGELLRLTLGHPQLELKAITSDSQPGESVAKAFPHLAPVIRDLKFTSVDAAADIAASNAGSAILAAAPHGISAKMLDTFLGTAEKTGSKPKLVDISADYRYSTAAAYQGAYKHEHGAPGRISQFTCAVPEHLAEVSTPYVAHPGCFATAILLASVPLLKLGLVEPRIFASGITGSTGAGRAPVAGTHHPQRHSDLYAYNALSHRHTPEITEIAKAASGVAADFRFVPHSGPFARGIHVTVQATATRSLKTAELLAALQGFYKDSFFVRVATEMPRIKDVATSNFAHLSAVADGDTVAVMCAIDNLVKGAAGGAMQWMNRLLGFEETAGLTAPAPGWT